MKPQLSIVKIGGNVIEDPEALSQFITAFAALQGPKILVHGGGKVATELGKRLGIATQMVNGRRVTDAQSLELITMVYGGLANKNIVAQLQAQNCNALGLSGADGNSIRAHKRPVKEVDFGFVGDIDGIGEQTVTQLLNAGFVPVFCAISHDGNGQLLNTNADTIAAELAIGMGSTYASTLYYCFEKKGVLRDIADEDSVITDINSEQYQQLLDHHIIADGMLPKMHNCFQALNRGVAKVCIGNLGMLQAQEALYTTLTL